MKTNKKQDPIRKLGNDIILASLRRGSVLTVLLTSLVSLLVAYFIYSYLLADWSESAKAYRQQVVKKEAENRKTEEMLAGEQQFLARFKKIVGLYEEAKPLLPEETEVSEVLGQVQMAAQKNGVTLTGLMAVKESVKSPSAEKLYEREIPALVTGPYPQVVRFFTDVSRMPRILLVRDYSIISMKDTVSAGFTLVAYHAPPPGQMPTIPKDVTLNRADEKKK